MSFDPAQVFAGYQAQGRSGRRCITCSHDGVREAIDATIAAVHAGKIRRPSYSALHRELVSAFPDYGATRSAVRRHMQEDEPHASQWRALL